MKTLRTLVLISMCAALTGAGYAQGRGGGGGGSGGGQGAGAGHGAGGSSMNNMPSSSPGASRRDTPGKPADVPSAAPRSAAPAAQNLSGAMKDINSVAFAQRREVHDTMDMKLKSSRDALKEIQADAKASRVDARDDFKAALEDVKARERDVGVALKASRGADEANWEARRTALARADQNFADAIVRLRALPKPPTPPKP
jgi:hypothetical protein